jgi:hypothetical protein
MFIGAAFMVVGSVGLGRLRPGAEFVARLEESGKIA